MSNDPASDLLRSLLEQRDGLFGFILALTRDREAAEDIFQQVGLAVVEEGRRGARVACFLPWVHELARRRVAEHYRKNARRRALEQSVSMDEIVAQAFQENAADSSDVGRRRGHLEDCLEGLSDTQRDLIERRYRDRQPLRAIAAAADSTEGSVKVALWRVRQQLARCIEGKSGEGD